ncbi:MAG: VanW family protein [Pseudomonadota bacterium]
MAVLEASSLRPARRLRRLLLGAATLLGVLAVAVGLLALRGWLHTGEAMPGVRVLGTDLAGTSEAQLGPRIRGLAARRLAQPVPLEASGRTVRIEAAKLFTLDRPATVAAAMDAGRDSLGGRARSLLVPITRGVDVAPRFVVRPNAEARLRTLLKPFVTPPVDASVRMEGTEPVLGRSRAGTAVDLDALLAGIEARVAAGTGSVPVELARAEPAISDAAAAAAADEARAVVSAPVDVTWQGEVAGTLSTARLARLLAFEPRGSRLLVLLDRERLARVLDPAVAPHKQQARNAQFVVDGDAVSIRPSRTGTTLDADAAVVSVLTAAHATGVRTAPLTLTSIDAARTTAEAEALGITERISHFTTDMGPSSSNRIHNVHLMADYIDGTIVEPGDTFSFNESVGPRTPERGFLEGQMIVGSLLLPSIGGGVCQTATTLFNNAFELGLPIVERHNHSFYISHYPLGRDATVSWGGPDFKFRNDMEHAILIKTSYTDSTLTFSFYGTSEGRTIQVREGEKANWKEPTVSYALDPAAPRGSKRIERGDRQAGFDVTISRTVKDARGEVIRRDAFTSHYIPVGDTWVYGPGSTIPGSYFVIPTT